MAMNKREQELVEELRTRLALRFTEPVNMDVLIPIGDTLKNGYSFNSYSKRVTKSCSSSMSHSIDGWDRTNSRGPLAQFSSKLRALRAMRNDLELMFARELRAVDLKIQLELEEME